MLFVYVTFLLLTVCHLTPALGAASCVSRYGTMVCSLTSSSHNRPQRNRSMIATRCKATSTHKTAVTAGDNSIHSNGSNWFCRRFCRTASKSSYIRDSWKAKVRGNFRQKVAVILAHSSVAPCTAQHYADLLHHHTADHSSGTNILVVLSTDLPCPQNTKV